MSRPRKFARSTQMTNRSGSDQLCWIRPIPAELDHPITAAKKQQKYIHVYIFKNKKNIYIYIGTVTVKLCGSSV